jgi:hypothetical protein
VNTLERNARFVEDLKVACRDSGHFLFQDAALVIEGLYERIAQLEADLEAVTVERDLLAREVLP